MASVVIMAGGAGLRLRPLTSVVPKALAPIGGEALIDHQIGHLHAQGFDRIVVTTGYQAEFIEAYVGARYPHVVFVREHHPLGTAGPLAGAFAHVGDGPFLVLNCDVLTTGDLRAVMGTVAAHSSPLAVATVEHSTVVPFGVIAESDGNDIYRIIEKPALLHDIVSGVYAADPSISEFLIPGEALDMDQLIERVIKAYGSVARHRLSGRWLEVGRPEDLGRAIAFVADNSVARL